MVFLFIVGLCLPAWTSTDDFEILRNFDEDSSSMQVDKHPAWEFDLAGGGSLPLNSKASYPALGERFRTPRTILIIVSNPIEKKLQDSAFGSTSILHRLTEWMSGGLQFGYSFGHSLNISQTDVMNNSRGAFITLDNPLTFTVDYSMKIAELTPLLKMGPGLHSDQRRFKPYVLLGLGYYNVHQNYSLTLDGYQFKFPARSDNYMGTTVGGGLQFAFQDNWSLSAEARYQRVFQPNDTLQFFIPTLHMSYSF